MTKLYFSLAAVLIAAASVGARADNPAASVAEPPGAPMPNPAGHAPVVEMPLKGNEPMSTGMKKPGMKKEDVKKDYMKKEQMIDELMEKGETKK
jgi:hypothetical protein